VRWLLVFIFIAALVVSLATRFQISTETIANVHSTASQSLRQHMNQDAVRWAVPILQLGLLQAPVVYPQVAADGPALQTFFLEDGLSKRPPPAC
jgi:hypothetical protein